MRITWTDSALTSFAVTLRYIRARFGSKVALQIREEIERTVEKLLLFPCMGTIELMAPDGVALRYIIVKKSKIYYYQRDENIVIFIIWDMRKDPDDLFALFHNR